MPRPEADALLIAKHLPEWPYKKEEDESTDREAVYLYWRDNNEEHIRRLNLLGLSGQAGIGRLTPRNVTKGVVRFDDVDTVRCRMVFVKDNRDFSPICDLLGRDVGYDEWEEAREWLGENGDDA